MGGKKEGDVSALETTHMSAAIHRMPPDIGIEVRVDAPHNPETCRDPACDCFPF